MRIKSLRISGFKSFCHPVHLQYKQNGITVVVGPNGCGKSNVVDAIRWVLGEQRPKHLRGGSMEDVIFAGSSFQKPSGMAEVTLTFFNPEGDTLRRLEDYTEIAVTRRLYRSGESVYMINKTPVRLKDVRELFMDTGIGGTGYSIIEQGRVGEIVSSKPAERRTLIDDAAGIVKFRVKRETAEKRMEETTQNLLRVNDVLGALSEQEEGLRGHVESAKTYLELQERSRLLERQHLCLSWHQAGLNEQKVQSVVAQLQQQQQDLQNEKAVVETEMERLNLEQSQRATKVGGRREQLFQKEQQIQKAENQRVLEKQTEQNVREQQQRQESELEELQKRQSELETEHSGSVARLTELSGRLGEMQAKSVQIEDRRFEENEALQDANQEASGLQKRLLTVHTELTNQSNQKNFLEERLENLTERQQKIHEQEQSHRNLLQEATLRVADSKELTENLRSQQNELSGQLNELETRIEDQQALIVTSEEHLEKIRHQQRTVQSRLESLQQIQTHYEGFGDSVKAFMQLLHDAPETQKKLGVSGLLADFIEVSPEFLDAVSPVMAEVLDWVVVECAAQLPQIENFCAEHKLGQLQFIALDRPPKAPEILEKFGTLLNKLLEFETPLREWGEAFFARFTLLEDDKLFWKKSEKNWPQIPEEQLSSSGVRLSNSSVRIGKVQSASLGFLQRRQQIQDLETQTEDLRKKINELENELENLCEVRQTFATQFEVREDDSRKLEFELLSGNKELEHHQLEERRMEQTVSQLAHERERLDEEIDTSRSRRQTAGKTIVSLESGRAELEEKTERLKERVQVQQAGVDALAEELLLHRVALTETAEQQKNTEENAERLRRECEETARRLKLLETVQREGHLRIEQSQKRIAEIDGNFGGMLVDRDNLKQELEEEILLHEQKNEEQILLTKQLQERQGHLEISVETAHQESLKLTEFRMQREQLEKQLSALTEESPETLLTEIDAKNSDLKKMEQELRSLKARLNAMGAVNLAAPEEHAALTERMDFLNSQSDDLQKAVADLRETIRDINIESRRRFREMFDQVNQRFQKVFTSLFEGGEAKLILTESEDLLSAGVDIVAQPPGKKLQNINLLSGGEKALTAISLIFAIFLIKPSPFCLLDEVDAPLDDINVVRFSRLIQSLTENSQFIIITHNKKTMEIGHRLYGVTMEEAGISKTVSVEFREAEQLIA